MPLLNRAALYWNTARHLRASQTAGRLWYRVWRPTPDLRAAPAVRAPRAAWTAPIPRAASLVGPARFDLLGRIHELPVAGGWDDAALPLLWRYNLHYFDDLNAADGDSRTAWHDALVERWTNENPPGRGTGWDPFPASLRIVNWIKWTLRGHPLTAQTRNSLAVQVRWLMGRLEYHLLGNHLLANAKALVYAGLFFEGDEADRWYERGTSILARELPEQILGDGGHFELSTMYHAIVLEDLLDLVNLLHTFARTVPADWLDAISRMRRWLGVMTHPDGEIAFFNDAAFGIAPARAALEDYAARLALPAAPLADAPLETLDSSGYARFVSPDAYLVCDCAAVGPDYQPGHAHADTLSFELSLQGRRVLVNSGTSEYGAGPERQRQRGTAAHNTVVIDAENSSEVWGGFRVARRARCSMQVLAKTPPFAIEGVHDGYRRLRGGNVHRRRWTLDARSLRIDDHIDGPFDSAEAWFHFHPEVKVAATDRGVILQSPSGPAHMTFEGAASVSVRESTWHPHFSERLPNRSIAVRFAGPRLTTHMGWERRA